MDQTLGLLLTIFAAGMLTFLTRLSFIALHGRVVLPEWFQRALTFVPVAVLSAITLPEIVAAAGQLNLSPLNPRVLAGVAAVLVAWRTKNVWATIVVGMLALITMQVLLGIQLVLK